jgi:hypothetical protein
MTTIINGGREYFPLSSILDGARSGMIENALYRYSDTAWCLFYIDHKPHHRAIHKAKGGFEYVLVNKGRYYLDDKCNIV